MADEAGKPLAMKPLRVGIAVPTHEHVPAQFASSIQGATALFAGQVEHSEQIETFVIRYCIGTYIHKARQTLAEELLTAGCDVIVWFDSDMRFPVDTIHRLLSHGKDIVGANYVTRTHTPHFVSISEDGMSRVPTTHESEGLEKVGSIGMGVCLTHASVFEKLPHPEENWWFWFDRDQHLQHIGEDVFFCRAAREAGFDVWVDHDLSKQVRHIGSIEYAPEHANAFTEERRIEVVK